VEVENAPKTDMKAFFETKISQHRGKVILFVPKERCSELRK
jgi:hypothetical protein